MRIFSIDDFVKDRLPRREDFRLAIDQFEAECVLPYLGTKVYGTLLYGSANRDDFSIASDVDYLMVVFTSEMYEIVRNATKKAFDEKNILISARVVTLTDAQEGMHAVDKDFLGHLRPSAERYKWKGNNPLDVLADDGISLLQATRLTVNRYSKRLVMGYTSPTGSEAEYLDFLKSILEKPWHTMRAMLQYKGITLENDSKSELVRQYKELGMDARIVEDIIFIQNLGRKYLDHLKMRQQQEKEPAFYREAHQRMLGEIQAAYCVALRFIDANKSLMKP